MDINKLDSGVTELSAREAAGLYGGESLWYWIAYGVGATVRGLEAMASGANESAHTMPGLK